MIFCNAELISGCVFGIEHVYGGDVYDDDDSHYLSIDIFFFRLVIQLTRE